MITQPNVWSVSELLHKKMSKCVKKRNVKKCVKEMWNEKCVKVQNIHGDCEIDSGTLTCRSVDAMRHAKRHAKKKSLISFREKFKTMSNFPLRSVYYMKDVRIISEKLFSFPTSWMFSSTWGNKTANTTWLLCISFFFLKCLHFLYPGEMLVAPWRCHSYKSNLFYGI